MNAPTPDNPKVKARYDRLEQPRLTPPPKAFAAIWPPLFMALTISGLRIWNAPPSPARTQALTLWGAVQALNAVWMALWPRRPVQRLNPVWMALGPRRLGGQVSTAVASLGASAAYVWRARKVDPPAAG